MLKIQKLKYIPVVTCLRGIAALLVCLYHFVVTTTGYIESEIIKAIFHVGDIGVQMFFVISGIVLPLSMINGKYNYKSIFIFLKKRLIRIEPPYLLAVLLAIIYLALRNFVPNSVPIENAVNYETVLAHIGYLVPFLDNIEWLNPVFWTLAIEFQFYFLLMFLFPILVKKKLYLRLIAYLVILIPGIYLDFGFFKYAGLFMLGINYVLYNSARIPLKEYLVLSMVVSICILNQIGFRGFCIGWITVFIIYYFPRFQNQYLNFLGLISYSLYLTHTLTGQALINVLSHYFNYDWQKPLVIIAGLIFSLITAYVYYLLIEKPFQIIAGKIRYEDKNKESTLSKSLIN